jgi:hypothetical protein
MDKWKAKEIKIMELGGNKKAHEFYSKNNMFVEGMPDHENPALSKYKQGLAKQALAALGDDKPHSTPVVLQKESEISKIEEDNKGNPFGVSEPEKHHAAEKISSSDAPSSSSVYSFSNLKQSSQPANLNAKKLDIDFGGDDFFDSFGVTETQDKKESKQKTKNENPFDLASGNDEPGPFQLGSGFGSRRNDNDDEFVKNKLKELQGKKGISSEDFKNIDNEEHKENMTRFQGATAISSSDYFGETRKSDSSQGRASLGSFGRDSFGDKVSEGAIYVADAVAQNAKKLKEKAGNFWATITRTSET